MRIIISENILLESTTPFVKKIIDPALMTWDEFHDKVINPSNKWHESSAYKTSYAEAVQKKDSYMNIKEYPILLNNMTINGRRFEVRKKQQKRLYSLVDEKGQYILDQNGRTMIMNDVERKAMKFPEFFYEIAIFDENEVQVASAQNEWGALLITTVEEFRSWGLAKIVLSEYRKEHPDADSGGFTNAGYNLTKSYYFDLVRDYLAKGFYTHLIKNGHISKEKVKIIIQQLPNRKKQKVPTDLNFNDPRDIMVIDLDNGEFILYNRKIIPIVIDRMDMTDHFIQDGLLGHIRPLYMTHKKAFRLQLFYAKNKTIAKVLNLLLQSYLHDEDILLVDNDEHNMFEQHIDKSLYNIKQNLAQAKTSQINYNFLNKTEQKVRLEMCNSDRQLSEEVYTLITELAYVLSED